MALERRVGEYVAAARQSALEQHGKQSLAVKWMNG